MPTLTLTDNEAYILNVILGSVVNNSSVSSLLSEVDSLIDRELECSDYDKLTFRVDGSGNYLNVQLDYNGEES